MLGQGAADNVAEISGDASRRNAPLPIVLIGISRRQPMTRAPLACRQWEVSRRYGDRKPCKPPGGRCPKLLETSPFRPLACVAVGWFWRAAHWRHASGTQANRSIN